jgi:hypothetical protein
MRTEPPKSLTPEFRELQRRVRHLLDQLGNPALTALAKKSGLGHDFIRDLVQAEPRKRGVSSTNLPKLAAALGCDVEYLTLAQSEPRRPRLRPNTSEAQLPPAQQQVRFGGFVEPGAWRSGADGAASFERQIQKLIIPQDLGDGLVGYIMRGDSMAASGVIDAMVLIAKPRAQYEAGDFVIVRRAMGGLTELSLRRLASVSSGEPVFDPLPMEGVQPLPEMPGQQQEIEAVMRMAVRIF